MNLIGKITFSENCLKNMTVVKMRQSCWFSVDGMDDTFMKKILNIEMVSMIFHGHEYFRFGQFIIECLN